jgi:predicted translin family RNA/ssDNA-binding protein
MEEQIEFYNVFKILIEKFPDVIKDSLVLDKEEILEYIIAGDFVRYIIKNISENKVENLRRCLEFIELLHINGTKETKELATIGYLEILQNLRGGQETEEKYKIIYDFLGIESKKWWNELNKYWSGNINALN